MAFLVFEGLDGAGKSSLMDLLEKEFKCRGIPTVRTREPGGTFLGEVLRKLILDKSENAAPCSKAELLLYEASRAQHVSEVIAPALLQGHSVLCDRFTASSVAFQAGGRGIQASEVHWLNDFATGGVLPHLNILLDLTVEEAQRRQQKRFALMGECADRMESEAIEFHERVRTSFLDLAKAYPGEWIVLDASLTVEQLFEELKIALRQRALL